jgi:hypothetical protein
MGGYWCVLLPTSVVVETRSGEAELTLFRRKTAMGPQHWRPNSSLQRPRRTNIFYLLPFYTWRTFLSFYRLKRARRRRRDGFENRRGCGR